MKRERQKGQEFKVIHGYIQFGVSPDYMTPFEKGDGYREERKEGKESSKVEMVYCWGES